MTEVKSGGYGGFERDSTWQEISHQMGTNAMNNPQQPEPRRSGKSAAEAKSADAVRETKSGARHSGRPHGTGKGAEGGGKSSGVPPGRRPHHPG